MRKERGWGKENSGGEMNRKREDKKGDREGMVKEERRGEGMGVKEGGWGGVIREGRED